MNSRSIRQAFLDFFASKGHKIVPSAPIVVKNDPTLMFTNAGMNQFKDYFLGNQKPPVPRIADSQKCLRVSGKHNDLEEVGSDGYHHTLFEMLGNWSFGDYFKEDAIAMAWELLTGVYGLDPGRLYVSVFGGDGAESLAPDEESRMLWKAWIPESRILAFSRKDNFWEMGDTGPCGPCSEIHYDARSEEERAATDGARLVNAGDPRVIEIWNLVFIQFNRKADGSLEELPQKHVDTGMGFERLCMVLQGVNATYDTDIFKPLIEHTAAFSGLAYTGSYAAEAKSDMAMRVMADHIRAVAFSVADGALPSNTGAGYVIRRILRRAVRYAYSFLGLQEPFLYRLVPILVEQMGDVYPELKAQQGLIVNVISEEEQSFLRTLEGGLRRLEGLDPSLKILPGELAFELYDTYGFPFDLTQLIARERKLDVDHEGFQKAMDAQRSRSKADAKRTYSDWTVLHEGELRFVGYDALEVEQTRLLRWRRLEEKGKTLYQMVFEITPFYPEGGGQVGDTGLAQFPDRAVEIVDTVKENELIIHLTEALPIHLEGPVDLRVNGYRRQRIENNHSATHLLHAALRRVLGSHVQQRGSLVQDEYLRFDFSHYQKVDGESLQKIEQLVNEKIRSNLFREEHRQLPMEEARKAGAMMLFGEKYGEKVRMISFDPGYSVELCGGCHVEASGQIGFFKIISESAVAAGIRRIEAVTAQTAERIIQEQSRQILEIQQLLKSPQNPLESVRQVVEENRALNRQLAELKEDRAKDLHKVLAGRSIAQNGVRVLAEVVDVDDARIAKNLAFQIGRDLEPAVVVLGFLENQKPQLMCYVSEKLVADRGFNASAWVRDFAKEIEGGGGGQAFFASAGGKNPSGLPKAIDLSKAFILEKIKASATC
ncbi:MAG: alanine--tRNA ligase [Saprospiraceae bacterium]|nr:alanine--tRNA ligase [Saprospiraceae bacterium]